MQLPIFKKKNQIKSHVKKYRVVIISGNTGCGKTTQVPQYLYEELGSDCKIVCTQPRRLAAVNIAKRYFYFLC